MKIAINTRLLLKDRLEGIGWFTFENFKRITLSHPEHDFYFIFDGRCCKDFIFGDNVHPIILGPRTRQPFMWLIWFEFLIPRVLKKIKADMFVSPDGYLSLSTKVPQLSVIHDINFVHRPNDFPLIPRLYYQRFFPKFAKKACRIATVSEFSKHDICVSYNVDPEKVDVVYNGANTYYRPLNEEEKQATKAKYTHGFDYFMFVGSLHPRKNVGGLLTAFDMFKTRYKSDHKLVIVGEKMFLTSDLDLIYNQMRYGDDVIFTGRMETEDLENVLGASTALVFVPFFEGFGIPIVEAMYAGVPVICSNTTSLPEVAGEAALYVDPEDVKAISNAMEKISSDDDLRNSLIEKGQQQKQKYSWDRSALNLWHSIEKCAQENKLL